ncbi:hypothetical protein LBMAG10_16970 [Actinomycetes bacterium]|nr:hypothetical protein LBMAG10_16970 [Actinomycetes bacterium]
MVIFRKYLDQADISASLTKNPYKCQLYLTFLARVNSYRMDKSVVY